MKLCFLAIFDDDIPQDRPPTPVGEWVEPQWSPLEARLENEERPEEAIEESESKAPRKEAKVKPIERVRPLEQPKEKESVKTTGKVQVFDFFSTPSEEGEGDTTAVPSTTITPSTSSVPGPSSASGPILVPASSLGPSPSLASGPSKADPRLNLGRTRNNSGPTSGISRPDPRPSDPRSSREPIPTIRPKEKSLLLQEPVPEIPIQLGSIHQNERNVFKCKICFDLNRAGHILMRENQIENHLLWFHQTKHSTRCGLCFKFFGSHTEIRKHNMRAHGGVQEPVFDKFILPSSEQTEVIDVPPANMPPVAGFSVEGPEKETEKSKFEKSEKVEKFEKSEKSKEKVEKSKEKAEKSKEKSEKVERRGRKKKNKEDTESEPDFIPRIDNERQLRKRGRPRKNPPKLQPFESSEERDSESDEERAEKEAKKEKAIKEAKKRAEKEKAEKERAKSDKELRKLFGLTLDVEIVIDALPLSPDEINDREAVQRVARELMEAEDEEDEKRKINVEAEEMEEMETTEELAESFETGCSPVKKVSPKKESLKRESPRKAEKPETPEEPETPKKPETREPEVPKRPKKRETYKPVTPEKPPPESPKKPEKPKKSNNKAMGLKAAKTAKTAGGKGAFEQAIENVQAQVKKTVDQIKMEADGPPVLPIEKSIERPIEKSIERLKSSPIEKSREKLSEALRNRLKSSPIEKSIEKPIEKSIEKSIEKPIGKTIEKPIKNLIEKTIEKAFETPKSSSLSSSLRQQQIPPSTSGLPASRQWNFAKDVSSSQEVVPKRRTRSSTANSSTGSSNASNASIEKSAAEAAVAAVSIERPKRGRPRKKPGTQSGPQGGPRDSPDLGEAVAFCIKCNKAIRAGARTWDCVMCASQYHFNCAQSDKEGVRSRKGYVCCLCKAAFGEASVLKSDDEEDEDGDGEEDEEKDEEEEEDGDEDESEDEDEDEDEIPTDQGEQVEESNTSDDDTDE